MYTRPAGGAAEMSRRTGAPVLVHGDDHGWARSGRISDANDVSTRMGRLFARAGDGKIQAFEPGPALTDGELLTVSGGLRVVHTPGHSPGHVSLLVERTGTLITGDALFNFGLLGGARVSPAFLCSDFAMTKQTAHRLGDLEYDVVAFTHGPEIRGRCSRGRCEAYSRPSTRTHEADDPSLISMPSRTPILMRNHLRRCVHRIRWAGLDRPFAACQGTRGGVAQQQVGSSRTGQDAGTASSSSMVRARMIGEGTSHNTAREPPIAATTRVGAMPRNSPATPPTIAPRGRIP